MTDKEYVTSIFPDSYLEKDGPDYFVYSGVKKWSVLIIGDGGTKDEAWRDARAWIMNNPDMLPLENKYK